MTKTTPMPPASRALLQRAFDALYTAHIVIQRLQGRDRRSNPKTAQTHDTSRLAVISALAEALEQRR